METSLTDLPDELITHILQHTLSEHASLCVGLIASCKKLHALSREDALWEAYHVAHWGQPGRSGRVASSWYAECKRRHTQDADAVTCVHELSHAVTRSAAWKRLVSYGEEALGRVCALCSEEAADPAVRAEAEKAAVALNQSVVRREWVENLARLQRPSREAGPAYEDGALLLVRLYQTAASLKANGPHGATRSVTDALDSLAARLRATLEASGELEQGPISAVSAVRALSSLLFAEEGFGGNVEDYYNYQNSLLDHVITMKKGIPISLSVLFAAVCSRVGVRAPCLFFSSLQPNPSLTLFSPPPLPPPRSLTQVTLDFIGLPGHFLLATRPDDSNNEPIFVDAFHGGDLLDLTRCQVRKQASPHPPHHLSLSTLFAFVSLLHSHSSAFCLCAASPGHRPLVRHPMVCRARAAC